MVFEEYHQNIPLLHSWTVPRYMGGDEVTPICNTGGFGRWHLESLYNFLHNELSEGAVFLETGAGNSTITLLFLKPTRLVSISPDAAVFERIQRFCKDNDIPDIASKSI